MATLKQVLELCKEKANIVDAQRAMHGFDDCTRADWARFLQGRLQKNVDEIDAKLKKLSGFKENVTESFVEGLAE